VAAFYVCGRLLRLWPPFTVHFSKKMRARGFRKKVHTLHRIFSRRNGPRNEKRPDRPRVCGRLLRLWPPFTVHFSKKMRARGFRKKVHTLHRIFSRGKAPRNWKNPAQKKYAYHVLITMSSPTPQPKPKKKREITFGERFSPFRLGVSVAAHLVFIAIWYYTIPAALALYSALSYTGLTSKTAFTIAACVFLTSFLEFTYNSQEYFMSSSRRSKYRNIILIFTQVLVLALIGHGFTHN
jgi:hypothetical protein